MAHFTFIGYTVYKRIKNLCYKGKPVEKLGRKAMGLKYGMHTMAAGCQRGTDCNNVLEAESRGSEVLRCGMYF